MIAVARICLLAFSLLLAPIAGATGIFIDSLSQRMVNELDVVDVDVRFEFSNDALEALRSGVPLVFNFEFKVTKARRFLWDQTIVAQTRRYELARHALADRYVLTLKLFELAHLTPPIRRLVSHGTPVLRRFARDSAQAVHLVIHDRNVLVVVAQVDSPSYWNVSIRVGARLGMATTGSGHIFLAFATDEERLLMLEDPVDRRRETLPAGLREHLALIAERGHEVMVSEQVASVTNLSVPVFGPLGTVIASLTSPYTPRLDVRGALDQQATLDLLVAAGHEISARSLKTS